MDTPTNSEMWEIRQRKCFGNNPLTTERRITVNLNHGGESDKMNIRGVEIYVSNLELTVFK